MTIVSENKNAIKLSPGNDLTRGEETATAFNNSKSMYNIEDLS